MKLLIFMALVAALPFAAHAEVTVTEAWARASILASRPGAAYLTLKSDVDDRLIGVTTPVADEVTLHATETNSAGIGRMVQIEALDLPAEEAVTLTPGRMHLILMGPSEKFAEGTTFPLILHFETAGKIVVDVPVLGVAAAGPEGPAK
ncbi:copper chaperone PCu(A)C [Jannaschia rubra]|uniref:Copper chaperone PCu(A)C n=1 Tax=Jannaschia rubra TaxID=282197 RepID=A0A0M6XX76_9RHOB|nr:copper chaperone PCu(A)C [Jannaschia rubra]CTQ34524.1 hypothetical protein JAN5088_03320 [Jannaschia rubra]